MASTPTGDGDWEVASDGGVFSFGDAQFDGSTGSLRLIKPVVGIAATTDGRGYWTVASDGGVFSYGDAQFRGSMGERPSTSQWSAWPQPQTEAATGSSQPMGGFSARRRPVFRVHRGDASQSQPGRSGMAATQDGGGYYLVAADGGIFGFGDAPFRGSMGGAHLSEPVVEMATTPRAGTATGLSRPTAGSSASGVLRFSGRGSSRAVMCDRQIRVG